jgi:hypothetical protein
MSDPTKVPIPERPSAAAVKKALAKDSDALQQCLDKIRDITKKGHIDSVNINLGKAVSAIIPAIYLLERDGK